ncbi:MAG: membrane protein insertion efficiency factor YidD [Brevinematia bacterium]
MVRRIFALLLIFFFLLEGSISGENNKVIERFTSSSNESKIEKKEFLPDSPNILVWTGLLLVKLYQTFISSQDRPVCVFEPSCSRYTEVAIKKYGFFRGVIMGAERLERCHPKAYGNYPLDEKNWEKL